MKILGISAHYHDSAAALLLDQSGSILSTDPTGARLYSAKAFLGGLGADDRVLLAAFAGSSAASIPTSPLTVYGPFHDRASAPGYFATLDALAAQVGGNTPLYASLEKLDHTLLEAAADLGSPPLRAFWQVTFPLSMPGVIAGAMLVFIPVTGEFVIPDLLGGTGTLMIGKTLWEEFFHNRDWPMASTVAVILLIVLVVPIVFFQNSQARVRERERGR